MSIKPVLKMGNHLLTQPSQPITNFDTPELKELINDLQETMRAKNGVGISAPQIGCNLRILIFGFSNNIRYPYEKAIPLTILINPTFKLLSEQMIDGWEACLSLPGLRGLVPRYQDIEYRGFDLNGNMIERRVSGFHARVFQHEYDHLDGILYPQKIKDLKMFGYEEELKDIIWPLNEKPPTV